MKFRCKPFPFIVLVLQSCLLFAQDGNEAFCPRQNGCFEAWSADKVFTKDYCLDIEKNPSKDFVILNLADIQLTGEEALGEEGMLASRTIDRLVEKTAPDLITLTGDNAWDTTAYRWLVALLDSYGIPWAPVMGNHDGQNTPGEAWCASQFCNARHCLFRLGPSAMGFGNYIINIRENRRIVHTLFMMDTHSIVENDNINGKKDEGYDNLWPNQLEWYEWAVNGIAVVAGKTVPSTLFIHIPLVEFATAYDEAYDVDRHCYKEPYVSNSFGTMDEKICCSPQNNGMFALCKRLGSTKNIACGHDHVNDYSIPYQGIRLTYCLKTGKGCYWDEKKNGGTIFLIDSDGGNTVRHEYVDSQQF